MLLIFDWDGTIVDSEYPLCEAVAKICLDEIGIEITADEVFTTYAGLGSKDKFRTIAEDRDIFIKDAELDRLQVLHRTAKKSLYGQALTTQFNKCAEVFEELQNEGHTLAICSNASDPEALLEAVKKLGFDRFFENRIYTQYSVGNRPKPDPAMVDCAMDESNFLPEDAVFIGDTFADMGAATNATIPNKIAFINRRYGDKADERANSMISAGATHIFTGYEELPGIIKSIQNHISAVYREKSEVILSV